MSDETAKANTDVPSLSGQVLLYKSPEPLLAEKHSALGLKQLEKPFNFVANTHVVPLTVQEFGLCAATMPIIIAPDRRTPLAVMSAQANNNSLVKEDGYWEMDAYVPAFVRRYPFVFAADENQENLIVCIDTDAEMIGEDPALPLFVNGELSDYSKGAIEFLQEFERQRHATTEFLTLVDEMGLLEDRSVTFTPQNPDGSDATPVKVADYLAISEEKLNALPAAKVLELKQRGALAPIYAHLVSLLQWQKMVSRAVRLQNPPVANA